MARAYFLPNKDAEKSAWLQNFAGKLPDYAAKYNVSAAAVTDMIVAASVFASLLNYKKQYEEFLQKITAYKNAIRDGIPFGADAPTPLSVPGAAIPQTITPGIFDRATALANMIKDQKQYSAADGHDLGIEGTEAITDPESMKPQISVRLIGGGHPEILWTKARMDGVEIYKNSGDGNWMLLAYDTHPDYTDKSPLPASGQSAEWKYRCIYRRNDEQVGSWSDEAVIFVHGV